MIRESYPLVLFVATVLQNRENSAIRVFYLILVVPLPVSWFLVVNVRIVNRVVRVECLNHRRPFVAPPSIRRATSLRAVRDRQHSVRPIKLQWWGHLVKMMVSRVSILLDFHQSATKDCVSPLVRLSVDLLIKISIQIRAVAIRVKIVVVWSAVMLRVPRGVAPVGPCLLPMVPRVVVRVIQLLNFVLRGFAN